MRIIGVKRAEGCTLTGEIVEKNPENGHGDILPYASSFCTFVPVFDTEPLLYFT